MHRFRCKVCGEEHDGIPDVAYDVPAYFAALQEDEKEDDAECSPDLCRIREHRFIRGVLELPIRGTDERFAYGVWMSVSQTNFDRYVEVFDVDPPPPDRYVGWISNRIEGWPDTLELVAAATLVPDRRPAIELEPTDHPLAVAQREGLTPEQVDEIVARVLHPHRDQT